MGTEPPDGRWKRLQAALLAIAAVAALSALPDPLAAQAPQDAQSLAQQAIRRLDLQTDLPRGPEQPRFIQLPAEFLWGVLVIALGLFLYAFRDMLPILRWRHNGVWMAEDAAPGQVKAHTPEAVLAAADDLAADGRFVEAMHVLLLQGLAEIRRVLDEQFADSLTSREILRSARLSDAGRASLRDIVSRVEWTYFGEHPAERADYVACRASFNVLARALHGRTAA